MARIRCNACGTEIEVTQANKSKACGCDNHTLLRLDRNGLPIITGEDLSKVVTIDGFSKPKAKKLDNQIPPEYTKRIPRKMEFEVR
jgi:hypothetical protein